MRYLFCLLLFCFFIACKAYGQNSQTVTNNNITAPIIFSDGDCTYKWVNSNPAIGLPASGVGNIPSFIAINTGSVPITATITATSITPGFAYIPNFQKPRVSVINTQTNDVAATIPVGFAPFGVAVNPNGTRAYVEFDDSLAVINTQTNTLLTKIAVGHAPLGVIVSSDGQKVYVGNEGSANIAIVNAATNAVDSYIPLNGSPYGLALSPDGKTLYATLLGDGTDISGVAIIDIATGVVNTTIPVGLFPGGVAINADGSRLYVVSIQKNDTGVSDVSVINIQTNKVINKIEVGNYATGIVLSRDGGKAYVTISGSTVDEAGIMVLDIKAGVVKTFIPVAAVSLGLSFSPDGSKLYSGDNVANNVVIINTATNGIDATVNVGYGPNFTGNAVTAGYGCSIMPLTYTITVNPTPPQAVFVPNTFTPNGDGTNDTWSIKNINTYPGCSVAVFNRYGAKVYASIGYQAEWNGTYNGARLPTGTYYYVIDLKNGAKALAGSLTIIR